MNAKIWVEIEIPAGLKLTQSLVDPSALKGVLRDELTNKVVDIPDLKPVKNIFEKFGPKEWIITSLGVAIVAGVSYYLGTKSNKDERSGTPSELVATEASVEQIGQEHKIAVQIPMSQEIDELIDQPNITMSVEAWLDLLRKAVMVSSLEERMWMILSSVKISGEDSRVIAWQEAIKSLTPREMATLLRAEFEKQPGFSEASEVEELLRKLLGDNPDDGPAALGAPTH